MSNTEQLSRAPLIFVLAQIVFSPIKKMSVYVDDIQEQLRKKGFPRHEAIQVQQLSFSNIAEPEQKSDTHWTFSNKENTTQITLGEKSLTLQTTKYEHHDKFFEDLKSIIEILIEVADPSLIERLGLRYINLIKKMDDVGINELLNEKLQSIDLTEISDDSSMQSNMTHLKTKIGMLRILLLRNYSKEILPPDLVKCNLKFDSDLTSDDNKTIIDIDHSIPEISEDFSSEYIMEKLSELHDLGTYKAFRAAVTPKAMELWSKK